MQDNELKQFIFDILFGKKDLQEFEKYIYSLDFEEWEKIFWRDNFLELLEFDYKNQKYYYLDEIIFKTFEEIFFVRKMVISAFEEYIKWWKKMRFYHFLLTYIARLATYFEPKSCIGSCMFLEEFNFTRFYGNIDESLWYYDENWDYIQTRLFDETFSKIDDKFYEEFFSLKNKILNWDYDKYLEDIDFSSAFEFVENSLKEYDFVE